MCKNPDLTFVLALGGGGVWTTLGTPRRATIPPFP